MRAKFTSRLASAYKAHIHEPGADLIRRLLIDSLSPQERLIYHAMVHGPGTARELVTSMGLRLTHASTILARLHKYGLLGRVWESESYCFVYFQANGVEFTYHRRRKDEQPNN